MTAPPLLLRSWLGSRRVIPAAAGGLLLSVALAFPSNVAGLQLGHWSDTPPLTIAYENITAALSAIATCAAMLPAAPEWERSGRPSRLRRAHLVTWLIVAVAVTAVGPVITALRLSYEPHPWSVVTSHLLVCGVVGAAMGLVGAVLGGVCTVIILGAVLVTEQTTGVRWIVGDPFTAPALVATTVAVLLGAWVQWRTAGTPPWRVRTGEIDD